MRLIFIIFIMVHPVVHYGDPGIKCTGKPLIRQYKRTDFEAGRQTWMIEQGSNGMMYFANNDGLLEYDGNKWRTYQLPNHAIVRSIKSDGKGRIYAGGFDEFGYFEAAADGRMAFHSMTGLLADDRKDFGEVWRIHLTPSGVIFQTFRQIILIQDSTVVTIQAPEQFHFSFYVNGELYIVDRREGLLRMVLGKLLPVEGTEYLKGREVWGILPYEEKLLIATAGEGVFIYDGARMEKWAPSLSEQLARDKIYCMAWTGMESIAFGTIQNGLIISDPGGQVLQSINRDQGLQNNTVLSMNTDDNGNLWLGLDNGIDYVESNSPLSLLSYQYGLSAGYTALIHNGILYLGTNQGVYAADWNPSQSLKEADLVFRAVENTSGQVWKLQVIDGQIFCGHNDGTFLIDGYQAVRICDLPGGWTYLQLRDNPGKVIGGTYSGLVLFEKVSGKWVFKNQIKGFTESSRDLWMDRDNYLWMSHGLKGLYRIRLNDRADSIVKIDFFNSSNGLPTDYGMTIFRFQDSLYAATRDGIYEYDETGRQFVFSSGMNNLLGKRDFRKIIVDEQENIWYFTALQAGVFRLQEDGSYLDISLPFEQIRGSFIGGFQYVYPYDEHNVFFGTENGFIHYDPSFLMDYTRSINTYIREVRLNPSDSILFRGAVASAYVEPEKVKFRFNSLHFYFAANDFENPDRLEYSSFLDGQEESLSDWGAQGDREFTNLQEGTYTFRLKARNIYKVESAPVSFTFTILPPWQRSLPAFGLYGLLFLIGIVLGLLLVRRKINKSKRAVELLKEIEFRKRSEALERTSLAAEKEIIRLRNEKLREEMVMKDKELANSTLQMIQKNKLLVSLIQELTRLNSISQDPNVRAQIRSLIKKINKDNDTDSQWKVFETHFESVHEEFLKRIKAEFPDLTPGELKLCAYLRLNISSKEIAFLMNISTRGAEISRYRLRKKLKLDRDINLTDFILSYPAAHER